MVGRFAALILVVAAIAGGNACAAETAFAFSSSGATREVVQFPIDQPGSTTLVGAQADSIVGLDFDPTAQTLFALNFTTHVLGTLSTANGTFAPLASVGATCCNGFTIDPAVGDIYAAIDDEVFRIDPVTGAPTLVTVLFDGSRPETVGVSAIAMNCARQGFAIVSNSLGTPELYRWSPTGTANYVGDLGYLGGTSLEFDNVTGQLYGWFQVNSISSSNYVAINPATAATTPIASGGRRIRMSIRNSCPTTLFADGFEN